MLGKKVKDRRVDWLVGWLFGLFRLFGFGFGLVLVRWRLSCSSPIPSRIRAVRFTFLFKLCNLFTRAVFPLTSARAGGGVYWRGTLLVLFSWLD